MADTVWCGATDGKLYLTSGEFSAILKDSEDITSIDTIPVGVSYDGANTPWMGTQVEQLYLQSGLFTSTLLTSQNVSDKDSSTNGISWDGTNTPWSGFGDDKLYLTSGQFTSTLITSLDVSSIETGASSVSWDGTNTPWSGFVDGKLYLTSGQFTSTLLDSEYIGGVNGGINGITYNGTDTPWDGNTSGKLYLQSGQFTSTIKTIQSVVSIDTNPTGIDTTEILTRLGAVSDSVSPLALSLTMAQGSVLLPGFPLTVTVSTLTIGLTPESSVTVNGDANVSPSALSLAFLQIGIAVVAGANLSISVLPLSLGIVVSPSPPTISGDVALFLPGVPMIILGTDLSLHAPEVSVTDDVKIVVTNTRTFAISEYTSMAYNSMAKFNGKYLYAKADGIYEGGGDNDNGVDIAASYKSGTFDINATEVQKLRNAWLNFRSDGDIQLFSVGNEVNTRWYPFVNSTNGTIHERRQKFERGIRDNHFSFGISNVAGSSFEIKTAKILTEPIRKRR